MSNPTLRTVTIDVVGLYNAAGKSLLNAYRTGAGRAIEASGTRYAEAVTAGKLPFINEDVKGRLVSVQQKISGFLASRLESDTAFTEKLMDTVADRTTGGIQYVADASERITSPLGTSVLSTIEALNLPFAQLSLKVAEKVAEGTSKIEARVAAQAESAEEATTTPAKPARRASRAVATV